MMTNFNTERLLIKILDTNDSQFILDILTSADFMKYIGDRNVRTLDDAEKYLLSILSNPAIIFYTVNTLEGETAGMVSVIKRDYLDHHDIGFAFLPAFTQRGYAFEATNAVLQSLLADPEHEKILAVVKEGNQKSIRLLQKLGLQENGSILVGENELLLYQIR